MKHYDSIPRIQDSGELKGEIVWGFNKLDGQNFCVAYNPKKDTFGPCGSRNHTVDENDLQFGDAVKWFKKSTYPLILSGIVKENQGKKCIVFKRSTMLKGQRRPSVKVKTKWWLEKLHSLYTEEECKLLE